MQPHQGVATNATCVSPQSARRQDTTDTINHQGILRMLNTVWLGGPTRVAWKLHGCLLTHA
ncbi:hypothetical protein [Neorhodopirellula lusitana]|uniref:hypothetical protein n=1 Tax=Neorhodopirellula lusitana TaxID=445327 RepID=UPI00384DFFA1